MATPYKTPMTVGCACVYCDSSMSHPATRSTLPAAANLLFEKCKALGWETAKIGNKVIGMACKECVLVYTGGDNDTDADDETDDTEAPARNGAAQAQAANLRLLGDTASGGK